MQIWLSVCLFLIQCEIADFIYIFLTCLVIENILMEQTINKWLVRMINWDSLT